MDLKNKFDFALEQLGERKAKNLKQEEIIFSSQYHSKLNPRSSKGYNLKDSDFEDIVATLESHFTRMCTPIAKELEFNMVNHFSRGVAYEDVYATILSNLKSALSHVLRTYRNKGSVVINLTSDQIEISVKDLILKPSQDERALYLKIKNNRFFSSEISSYKGSKSKLYEVRLMGNWADMIRPIKQVNKKKQVNRRKDQWERSL